MSAYFLALRGYTVYIPAARWVYYAIVVNLLVVASIQMINIVNHNFDISYVYGYSSRELASPFLYASFYAGQEGSFMLWTILTALLGLFLLPYVRRHGYEAPVMFFYALILSFLMLMLVAKNPFSLLWETYAKDGTTQAYIESIRSDLSLYNGKGLNPVLQNRWIMIHPPILFTGFAAMSVPFVFAMAGLIKREYQQWIRIALPWALFACGVLGFGIMLGGFWAYVTLGWGGFWAWDPVENSSLIPWLVCVALVHTMLVQRRTKGLVKTNISLALLAFLAVLYSTFLTRSGVLGDTSVHAFVEPGYFIYVLLLCFLVTFCIIGVGLIVWRWKEIKKIHDAFDTSSREFSLSLGSAAIMASALVVTLGTSYPMLAELMGKPKVAVEASFYNQMHIPLMVVIFILNSISISQVWKRTSWKQFRNRSVIAASLALVVTIVAFFMSVQSPEWLAMIFFSWLALLINLDTAWKIILSSPGKAAAYISHTGISFLILGIVATAGYSVTTHARLVEGQKTDVLGYQLQFIGKKQVDLNYHDREKYEYNISVNKDGRESMVYPVLYYSDFNKRQAPFLEPGIAWTIGRDLYVSPKAIERDGESPQREVVKGTSASFPFDSSVSVQLLAFDMSEARQSDMEGYLKLAVIAHIQSPDTSYDKKMYCYTNGTEFVPISYSLPLSTKKLAVMKIHRNQQDPDKSTATFAFMDTQRPETMTREVFVADVSVKPLINLVWTGVILMVFGFVLATVRHAGSASREQKRLEEMQARQSAPTQSATTSVETTEEERSTSH